MNKTYLKNRRLKLGLTMLELAKKVGVSEATISRWESGNIDNMKRDKISLLAKALEISPLEIIGQEETAKPEELIIPDSLKDAKVAFHRGEFEGLTQEEIDTLAEIAETLKKRRKKE